MGLDISEKHALEKRKRLEDEKSIGDEEEEEECDEIFTDDDNGGVQFSGLHMTYSGVHVVRRDLINMTIAYLEANETWKSKACIDLLEIWRKSSGIFVPLNYERIMGKKFEDEKILQENDVMGLFFFVAHSDSEGYLSRGQTIDLYDLLEKVMPFADVSDGEYYTDFSNFIKTCVENKRGLHFH